MSECVISVALSKPMSLVSYHYTMRMLGGLWFLLLAVLTAWTACDLGRTYDFLLAKGCLVLFYLMLCVLLVTRRSPAKSRARGIFPRLAAFFGTYAPWTMAFFPHTDYGMFNHLSIICLVVGMLLAIIAVSYLGQSFSLTPQAHTLVRSGPYHWLRHPLYISEEIATLGTLFQYLSLFPALIFLAHIALQVSRIVYEEKLLHQTFPEYAHYATSSWRLIPLVW